jgi:YD repeat-containing protein
MLYPIIEQSLSAIEGGTTKLIKKRKNTYTSYTNKYRDATYNTRVFLLTGSSFALNGGSLESRLSYVYNNKCDRISITKDTEKVTYLWAYNYMYPVAEIRGATYDELVSCGLSTNISNLATMTTTANVSSALATIRSSLASRPVLMTSYTYDPLIGITSTTAPNGTKTSYTYDVMGRLSNVKNHGGNIIRQHSYNYKTN